MANEIKQVGFYYNEALCAGCKTCQVACKDKNRLDVGVVLREVRSYQIGSFPDVQMYHFSATCNHCTAPACLQKCPVGAIEKKDDGSVVQDPAKCIGCQTCVTACPYSVPRYDAANGVVRKCDACYELRAQGYQPACVESCPFRALEFGDYDELAAKYGADAVTTLPAQGVGDTGPHTLIRAKACASELGVQITL